MEKRILDGTRCQYCIKNTRINNLCIVRVLARYMEYHINIRIEFALYYSYVRQKIWIEIA